MTPQEIYENLKDKFGESIVSFEEDIADPFVTVAAESLADVAQYLAQDEALAFDFLMCLSGVDLGAKDPNYYVVYHLYSMPRRHKLVLKIVLPKEEDPHVSHG